MQRSGLKHRWFWKLFYWPNTFQLKRQIKKIDLLICNSLYTKNAIMTYWGRDAEVIYPPVDIEAFKPRLKEPFVVSVGRFAPEKNYELIVQVAKQMPHVHFVIVGRKPSGDSYYDKIATMKPDNLDLETDVTRDGLSTLLGRAKIYLHSMIGEHFGISVIEAMASGCIPVVHNSGGPKETCEQIGFLYNNVEECVKAIGEELKSNENSNDIEKKKKMFSADNFKKHFLASLERNSFL
jgi:glycosyltransferase involved in cell wall biosynthesis